MADAKKASLTVLGGTLAGVQSALPHDGVVTIGSAADCTFQLDTPSVSPLHARLVLEDGQATVHATGSDRALHVNDNPLTSDSAPLRRPPRPGSPGSVCRAPVPRSNGRRPPPREFH